MKTITIRLSDEDHATIERQARRRPLDPGNRALDRAQPGRAAGAGEESGGDEEAEDVTDTCAHCRHWLRLLPTTRRQGFKRTTGDCGFWGGRKLGTTDASGCAGFERREAVRVLAELTRKEA